MAFPMRSLVAVLLPAVDAANSYYFFKVIRLVE